MNPVEGTASGLVVVFSMDWLVGTAKSRKKPVDPSSLVIGVPKGLLTVLGTPLSTRYLNPSNLAPVMEICGEHRTHDSLIDTQHLRMSYCNHGTTLKITFEKLECQGEIPTRSSWVRSKSSTSVPCRPPCMLPLAWLLAEIIFFVQLQY